MSVLSIAPYFPFRRIKIVKQTVLPNTSEARIQVEPDKRFQPVCHFCGQKAAAVHSWTQRNVRDLNMTATRVWLICRYRKLLCPHCHRISIEDLELFHPYLRVTTRLALYIHQLCQFMTVTEVANHVGLDWKTVKNIDKVHLEGQYGQPDYEGLRILAVDEIAVRKGYHYLTVVMDYLSGRIVFVGKDRKAKTLNSFFNQLTAKQRKSIEAVVMDMWDPFIKAVKKNYRRLKSCSICSMWFPNLTGSLIKLETVNIARPLMKTNLFLKEPSTCC
ncbi:MAG: transposase [Deltaproteobacteria bacterium]|nr:transposase [Deltaproteobacteria bacterium]